MALFDGLSRRGLFKAACGSLLAGFLPRRTARGELDRVKQMVEHGVVDESQVVYTATFGTLTFYSGPPPALGQEEQGRCLGEVSFITPDDLAQ